MPTTRPSTKVKGKAVAVGKWKRPKLEPLAYGHVYCELCHEDIRAGQPVAWVRVGGFGQRRWTAYCPTCTSACHQAGRPLYAKGAPRER